VLDQQIPFGNRAFIDDSCVGNEVAVGHWFCNS
jgi:hypothetical protein